MTHLVVKTCRKLGERNKALGISTAALFGLTLEARSQDAETFSLSEISEVAETEILPDGNLLITLTNGETVSLPSTAYLALDGEIVLTESGLAELQSVISGGNATLIAGALGLAGLAIAGGSGGGGDSSIAAVLPDTVSTDTTPPTISSESTASTFENVDAGTSVYATQANDETATSLTYSLSGSDAALFDIDPSTGVVAFIDSPDYEIPGDADDDNVYDITVTVSDGTNETSIDVALTVENVDEVAPVITSGMSASVMENSATDTVVYQATATDTVDNAGTEITYALSGADADLFDIDEDTGEITFKAAPDYETPGDADGDNDYEITVTASDGVNTSTSQAVTISVTNVDEVAPVITSDANASVAENSATDTVVYQATATDTADNAGTEITYALSGADADLFNIDEDTGEVTFKAAPDYETPGDADGDNDYEITITASDGVNTSIAQSVTITVTNVDEVAPVITSGTSASVTENSATSTIVYQAMATDTVDNAGTEITYTLSGADADLFNIDEDTGEVTFKAVPDFENPGDDDGDNDYEITVTASDGVNTSAPQAVTISVTNVDDVAPTITSGASASVAENSAASTVVYTATATDTVENAGTDLTYALSGTDAALFDIDEDTGEVTFKASPDFENPGDDDGDNDYEITITASDGVNTSTAKSVTITVTNVDEVAPVITSAESVSVPENTPTTTAFYTAIATDTVENAGTSITFALSGPDADLFNLDEDTGEVTFKTVQDYDVDSDQDNNVYEITITASDGVNTSDPHTVIINVTNVDEVAPVITSGTSAVIVEESATSTVVYQVMATDTVDNAGTDLTYAISGTDADLFNIDEDTGEITFKASPDYEMPGDDDGDNDYEITVTASDGVNTSTSQAVTISVVSVDADVPTIWNFDFDDTSVSTTGSGYHRINNGRSEENLGNGAEGGLRIENEDGHEIWLSVTPDSNDGNGSLVWIVEGAPSIYFRDAVEGDDGNINFEVGNLNSDRRTAPDPDTFLIAPSARDSNGDYAARFIGTETDPVSLDFSTGSGAWLVKFYQENGDTVEVTIGVELRHPTITDPFGDYPLLDWFSGDDSVTTTASAIGIFTHITVESLSAGTASNSETFRLDSFSVGGIEYIDDTASSFASISLSADGSEVLSLPEQPVEEIDLSAFADLGESIALPETEPSSSDPEPDAREIPMAVAPDFDMDLLSAALLHMDVAEAF